MKNTPASVTDAAEAHICLKGVIPGRTMQPRCKLSHGHPSPPETGAAARNPCSMKRGDVMDQTAELPGRAGFFHYKTHQKFWSGFHPSLDYNPQKVRSQGCLVHHHLPCTLLRAGHIGNTQWIFADFVNKWMLRNVCEYDWESSNFFKLWSFISAYDPKGSFLQMPCL